VWSDKGRTHRLREALQKKGGSVHASQVKEERRRRRPFNPMAWTTGEVMEQFSSKVCVQMTATKG
jgi:hypothetical protein